MTNEWNLEQLKKEYDVLQKKFSLPSFEFLNKDFQIEKASQEETDFVLREIRRYIADKFINYLRFIESFINPSNAPMFVFSVAKTLGNKEKEKLAEIYKKIARIEIELIDLDAEYSEEKEANFIKESSEIWQKIKKEVMQIVEVIKKNWDAKAEENNKGYFG